LNAKSPLTNNRPGNCGQAGLLPSRFQIIGHVFTVRAILCGVRRNVKYPKAAPRCVRPFWHWAAHNRWAQGKRGQRRKNRSGIVVGKWAADKLALREYA